MTHTTAPWTGRDDGPGPEHRRWHQHVTTTPDQEACSSSESVALVGFRSDEGVRRNNGRPGAAQAPAALRTALAPLAAHRAIPLHDLGDVAVQGTDLETGQQQMGELVAGAIDHHGLVVVLGGGHETAWASYLGRSAAARLGPARVGVLNLDAHFDLRRAERATSGTPFRQMADADHANGREFHHMVAGISRASNTPVLFDTAEQLGTRVVLDVHCQPRHLEPLLAQVSHFCARVDVVHLSIDLDVLPAAVAPGVSAPAGYGVPMEVVEAVASHVAASGQLVLVDVVELCPPLDVDSCTARAAARLVHSIVEAWKPARTN